MTLDIQSKANKHGTAVSGKATKGEKTRERIKTSVIHLLDQADYLNLTIAQICKEAGIKVGGFYFHYKNKNDVIEEVLRELFEEFDSSLQTAMRYGDVFSVLSHTSRSFVRVSHDHAGLVRCYNQISSINPDFVHLWENAALSWASGLAELIVQEEQSGADRKETFFKAYSMVGFADSFLYRYFVENDGLLHDVMDDSEQIAEALAIIWYRVLMGHDPDAARLAYFNRQKTSGKTAAIL